MLYEEDQNNEINDLNDEDLIDENELKRQFGEERENENELDNENNIEIESQNENEQIDENDSNSDNRFPEEVKKTWIHLYCDREGYNFLAEVSEDFLKKKINLIGIKYEPFISTIMSNETPQELSINGENFEQIQKINECYGLIHRRFIYTPEGLALMREKYLNEEFGHCPRILCEKQFLLPVGLSDDLKYSRVKVYCPLCEEVYNPNRRIYNDLDGAFFGTSFPNFFLTAYPDLNPRLKRVKNYIPKIFGFKIVGHKGSKYYSHDKNVLKNNLEKLGVKVSHVNLY